MGSCSKEWVAVNKMKGRHSRQKNSVVKAERGEVTLICQGYVHFGVVSALSTYDQFLEVFG